MIEDFLKEQILILHPGFPEDELEPGLAYFKRQSLAAREPVVEAGKSCNYLFFADRSVVRSFYLDESGEEKTVWMEPERFFVTDFESFIGDRPSKFNLEFYTDTNVLMIHRDDLTHLYNTYKHWAIFGIKLMESYHVRILELFTIMFNNDATSNYQFIEDHFKQFLKVAPLKDIASMLNLSPVSLSRIRAGKQTKTNS